MASGIGNSECLDYLDNLAGANESRPSGLPLFAVENAFQAVEAGATESLRACIVLIDPRPLSRTSISRLLSGPFPANRRSEDFSVWPVASFEEYYSAPPAHNTEVALMIFNLGGLCPLDEKMRMDHARMREDFPRVPLVILSDCANPNHILGALRDGARGYIPSALEPSMVMQAIRLVLAGGTFIPPGVLAADADPGGTGEPSAAEKDGFVLPCELTPRQTEVFDLLRQGKSNKVIAYELGMQESTVKVHVRQIMRKLKAINRTHAVFLATSFGGEASD
ncbi:LuxR C-terminal-related transcriptional regulator [Methylomagnum sp.]